MTEVMKGGATEVPTKAEYQEAKALIVTYNTHAQNELNEARAAGHGHGMQVGISPYFLNMYAIVRAYENRNWMVRLYHRITGSFTEMVELV